MPPIPESALVDVVVGPMVAKAGAAFLRELDGVTVDDLCQQAEAKAVFERRTAWPISQSELDDQLIVRRNV